METEWLTVKQAAAVLGITERSVRDWVKRKGNAENLKTETVGNRERVLLSACLVEEIRGILAERASGNVPRPGKEEGDYVPRSASGASRTSDTPGKYDAETSAPVPSARELAAQEALLEQMQARIDDLTAEKIALRYDLDRATAERADLLRLVEQEQKLRAAELQEGRLLPDNSEIDRGNEQASGAAGVGVSPGLVAAKIRLRIKGEEKRWIPRAERILQA